MLLQLWHPFPHKGHPVAVYNTVHLQRSHTTTLPSSAFTPSSVSLIDFGWPGRFRINACLRITPTWREDRRWHKVQAYLAHLLTEARHFTVGNRQSGIRGNVTARRAGTACGQNQWQLISSTSSHSVCSMIACSSGSNGSGFQTGSQRTAQPLFQSGDAFVLINTAGGAAEIDTKPMRKVFIAIPFKKY
jgi:hypothetical protein